MEEIKTMSPETLTYWNYVKDASPEVRSELTYFLVHVPITDPAAGRAEGNIAGADPDTEEFLKKFAGAWADMPGSTKDIIKDCESCRTIRNSREQHLLEAWRKE